MKEIERLKSESASERAESAMMIESLQSRIQQLEMELQEMRQIAESTSEVGETKPLSSTSASFITESRQ